MKKVERIDFTEIEGKEMVETAKISNRLATPEEVELVLRNFCEGLVDSAIDVDVIEEDDREENILSYMDSYRDMFLATTSVIDFLSLKCKYVIANEISGIHTRYKTKHSFLVTSYFFIIKGNDVVEPVAFNFGSGEFLI